MRNSSTSGKPRRICSIEVGNTLTPRMIIMSSVRPSTPPSSNTNRLSVSCFHEGRTRSPVRYRITGQPVRPSVVSSNSESSPSLAGWPDSIDRNSAINCASFTKMPVPCLSGNPQGPTSVAPLWSITRASNPCSIRSRIAGIEPPGSPATMICSNPRRAQVKFLLFRNLDQVQCIAGSTKHDRCIDREN